MPAATPNVVQTLQKAIDGAPRFHSVSNLLGGHQHTLGAYFLPQPKGLRAGLKNKEQVALQTRDGDTLVGELYHPAQASVGVLHVFHGLAGSSQSTYMPRAAEAALKLGLTTILWNHRGCGDGKTLAKQPYHSGRSDDLGRTVSWGRQNFEGQTQILLGYSLSANATALVAAGVIPKFEAHRLSKEQWRLLADAEQPDLCIAVNPPTDLYKSAVRLSRGLAKIYGQRFIVDLLACLHDREGVPEADAALRKLDKRLATLRFSVVDFDANYTGYAAGFRDHMDYYKRASCGAYLASPEIPLVVLTSADDPITHGLADLNTPVESLRDSTLLALDYQAEGGHMGYIDSSSVQAVWDISKRRWMETRIALYLETYLLARKDFRSCN